jgi:hypothetical protein
MRSRFTHHGFTFSLFVALALIGGCDPEGPTGGRRDTGVRTDAGGPPTGADADGDNISDASEGRASEVDTDGDGTADYLDDDSDADGISDAIEGGAIGGVPIDTDSDGTPDFRDLDSDGNGISDSIEGAGDPDLDGRVDANDTDDDGDVVRDVDELGAGGEDADTDADGVPDRLDLDSDGDTIRDLDELVADTDRDDVPDRRDLDSDQDGIVDTIEAGDADLTTPPVDTDSDTTPDFRDADSDDDGLSDLDEVGRGTSPIDADTDRDGVGDLIETSSGTDPLDGSDSPRTRGDFVFLEPYMRAPDPPRDTLDFATNLRRADVYFLMDTTGSMGGEIANLQGDISSILIPAIRARIPEAQMGVGRFDDYDYASYGNVCCGRPRDVPYTNLQSITDSDAAVTAGVAALTLGYGDDRPESNIQAIHAAVTGTPLTWPTGRAPAGDPSCAAGRFGYACFRPDAVPVFVMFTDAPFHNGPGGSNGYSFAAPTYDDVVAALGARNAHVISVDSGDELSRIDGRRLATDLGTVDGSGSPLVFTISATGTGLSDAVVDGIEAVSRLSLDISVRYDDDTTDAVDSFAAFVQQVVANEAGDASRGCAPRAAIDTNADGVNDTFPDVTPGARVCFDIVVKQNDTVMQTREPQLFRASLTVLGDGFTPLDSRDVYFLVPPTVPDPGSVD